MCQFKNTTYLLFKSIIGIKKKKKLTIQIIFKNTPKWVSLMGLTTGRVKKYMVWMQIGHRIKYQEMKKDFFSPSYFKILPGLESTY